MSKKLGKRETLILVIPAVLAALAVAAVLFFIKKDTGYVLPSDGTQIYAGATTGIPKGTSLFRDGQTGELKAEKGGEELYVTELPIYLDNKNAVVVPFETLLYKPRAKSYGKAEFCTEVSGADGQIKAKSKGKVVGTSEGFLFDGKNFYLFLEPVTVTYNQRTYELPVFSYAQAVYGNYVMLTNAETGEYVLEKPQGDAIAVAASGDYSISLLDDLLIRNNGKREMLFGDPGGIDSIFK